MRKPQQSFGGLLQHVLHHVKNDKQLKVVLVTALWNEQEWGLPSGERVTLEPKTEINEAEAKVICKDGKIRRAKRFDGILNR